MPTTLEMTVRRAAAMVVLVLAVSGLLVPAAAPVQAAERIITYTVSTRGPVAGNVDQFAAVARETLADPRGWSLGGSIGFRQVGSGSNFDLILASPQTIANASPGCSSQYSCRVGRSVYINDDRWRSATASWPHGLDLYQRYVILHEVGHWLGLGHTGCQTAGRTAWVMQQQSISLQGCRANVWPVIAERQQVARNQGVSVRWSAFEQRYLQSGQETGAYGYPVSWEKATGVGAGSHQVFQRGEMLWSPDTGVHGVYGAIGARYQALGGVQGPLRYPTTDETSTPDGVGRYNHFSGTGGGSIYWTPRTGAHEVYGAIHDRWVELRYEQGPLGYPISGEYSVPGGRQSDFERGSIRWDSTTGRTEVLTDG